MREILKLLTEFSYGTLLCYVGWRVKGNGINSALFQIEMRRRKSPYARNPSAL